MTAEFLSTLYRANEPRPDYTEGPTMDDHAEPTDGDLSDGDLANEFCTVMLNTEARYVAAWDRWLFWDGARWAEDRRLEHYTRADLFLKDKAARILAGNNDPDRLRAARAAAKNLKSAAKSHAVLAVCQRSGEVPAEPEQFDADLQLLGTPGGTVDLRTGILRRAAHTDHITKNTAVTPAPPGTPAPMWTQFLAVIFAGDADKIGFIQRALGYALTGLTTEQKLLFLYGRGRNGKGVLLQTMAHVMGDYATTVAPTLFTVKMGSEHPTGRASLQGFRLVQSSELERGATWNEEILKSLTGGDLIQARRMRQDNFNFTPQCTIFISGNNKPRFKGVGLAMRERFMLLTFTQSFTDKNGRRDPDLKAKLEAEWPAILRWAIDGALAWREQGLNPPASVNADSSAYLDEEDDITRFIEECLIPDASALTPMGKIYPVFRTWQEAQGVRPWTQTAITHALGEEGVMETKRTRAWAGASYVTCAVGYRLGS